MYEYVIKGKKIYYIKAYPKCYAAYAISPEAALKHYKKQHPEDKRDYYYYEKYNK